MADFLARLEPEDRALVEEAIGYDHRTLPATALHTWLLSNGFDDVPQPGYIQRHRKRSGQCHCP